MADTILVTGRTIGDSVVDGLIKNGRKVRVTAYEIQSKPAWAAAGIEQVEIDYARPETLSRAFEGVETYFSLSPMIEKLAETGIQGVNVANRAGVKRIVRSSVLGAADDGITFPRWHRSVERAVEGHHT
jgi:NAD(P)H dehydrogenase (quinone)